MATSPALPSSKTLLVLNGPNLNLLGTREPEVYGRSTLADVEALCRSAAKKHGFAVEFRQSNHEGDLVDALQEAGRRGLAGAVLNPGGLTHSSVSIHDAIKGAGVPVVEIHISNIHAREPWRSHSVVSPAAAAVVCGFGVAGYALAVDGLAAIIADKTGKRDKR